MQEIRVKCSKLADNLEGMVRIETKNLYVKDLLPGEEAIVSITKDNGRVMQGTVKTYITTAKERVKANCQAFDRCGACNMLHLDYNFQLQFKRNLVAEKLRFAGFNNFNLGEIKGMDQPFNYRNKIIAAFKYNKNNLVVPALFQEESNELVFINNCSIQSKEGNKVLELICEAINKLKIIIFDPYGKRKGVLKFVLIKVAENTGEIMVVFVCSSDIFPARNDLVKYITSRNSKIKTVVQNTNERETAVVLGPKERVLFGKGMIKDKLCGLEFFISSKSFYQVNSKQTEYLYHKAIELCDFKGYETVLDAYCGIGTIGLIASRHAKKVIGVEVNKEAYKNAILNSKLNNITNCRFYNADCTEFILEMTMNRETVDIVIMDPPREGSTKDFMSAVIRLKPKKIIYISCNPVTLAEDLKVLAESYNLKEVIPVDMFPHTLHVETCVLLERN
ncbi:MAG: 23S rRNA (uracil(1939)-C(5))-methyltransferase RlmD [Erysipelotrichales bacterium]|nr:23S rRNA (uracil(1939)-C(5))-methyltransferase RlmD [Erysipelotrichales bacterium]